MDIQALVVVAVAICAYAAISGRAERSPLTPPLFFVAVGLTVGPIGLGWLTLTVEDSAIHRLAELTLVLVLFTDASRIDLGCLRREGNLPLRLLGIGMPLTVLAGAGVAFTIWPQLRGVELLLVAAILAPTDAALGQAVVSNPAVPVRIRQSLNVESGLNDGIALPLVLVLAYWAGAREEGGGVGYWLRFATLALTLGPLVGLAVGALGGRVLLRAARAGWLSGAFERLSALGLALLAFAGAELIGGNGFIAAFVAGLALHAAAPAICAGLYEFGEAEGQLLTLLVFIVFGAAMVPEALPHWSGAALLYALASLTVVRMLPVALALWGSGLRLPSVLFLGWFGPRGLASILFALVVVEEGLLPIGDAVLQVVILTVLTSTVLHGLSAWPMAVRYGAWAATQGAERPERHEVAEMPVRTRHARSARH
jgi:NhaP-type Na+/H+ or K+/H+ antiporter